MELIYKLISWTLSFVVNFFLVTTLFAFNYIKTLYDLPVDIWNIVNEDIEEDAQ